jgi:hypothetical protein
VLEKIGKEVVVDITGEDRLVWEYVAEENPRIHHHQFSDICLSPVSLGARTLQLTRFVGQPRTPLDEVAPVARKHGLCECGRVDLLLFALHTEQEIVRSVWCPKPLRKTEFTTRFFVLNPATENCTSHLDADGHYVKDYDAYQKWLAKVGASKYAFSIDGFSESHPRLPLDPGYLLLWRVMEQQDAFLD